MYQFLRSQGGRGTVKPEKILTMFLGRIFDRCAGGNRGRFESEIPLKKG